MISAFGNGMVIVPSLPQAGIALQSSVMISEAGATALSTKPHNEPALRHYKRALASDPFYADAHVSLALLYEKLGLRRTARDHWRRYLQLDPGGSWADVARRHLAD